MKILSAAQTQQLDRATIEKEPIRSLDLMERAATAFCDAFTRYYPTPERPVVIFCGPGNNGGDGLAVARILHHRGYEVSVILCVISENTSSDYQANLKRLPRWNAVAVHRLQEQDPLPELSPGALVIDGIFGSGLNRPVTGYWAGLLHHLNQQPVERIAIDIPSGVFADQPTTQSSFEAHRTISFALPKLAFFLPENERRIGDWTVVPIGLHSPTLEEMDAHYYYTDQMAAARLLRPRSRFSHKGTFGHALLICGSYGMLGAAILSTRACLRSGAGLVSVHLPQCGYAIMQSTVPEAMVSVDRHQFQWSEIPDLSPYRAVGIGCGLGRKPTTAAALWELLDRSDVPPLVLDADALNLLSERPDWPDRIPPGSILTPHPGEFRRLTRTFDHHLEQLATLRELATTKKCTFVLKGAHTAIALPNGQIWFNGSGNPGMATGGTGDVLTGLLTGLLAQGYAPEQAAILGVFMHGMAGDLAAETLGHEALLASDIIQNLGIAFHDLKQLHV